MSQMRYLDYEITAFGEAWSPRLTPRIRSVLQRIASKDPAAITSPHDEKIINSLISIGYIKQVK